jgi:hypothetical protein
VFSFSEELVEFFKLKISAKGHFIFNVKIVEKLIYRARGMPWYDLGLGCHRLILSGVSLA